MQDKVHENLKKVLTDKKGSVTMGKRSQTMDRSFQHAEIYIRRKTAYGYDDEHGHDDVHAFCDVHMLLAIVLRCEPFFYCFTACTPRKNTKEMNLCH